MRQVERDLLSPVAWVGEFQSRASHLATDILGPVVAAEQVRDRQQMRHLQRFVAQYVGEANRADGDVMDEPIRCTAGV